MHDEVDTTFGPIKLVGSDTERISRYSDPFLWLFAAVIQFLFNVLIATPFLFYFVNVQDLKKTRLLSAVYYVVWYLENVAVVLLNLISAELAVWDPSGWPSQTVGYSVAVLIIPFLGFLILLIYDWKLDPEMQTTDSVDLHNSDSSQPQIAANNQTSQV